MTEMHSLPLMTDLLRRLAWIITLPGGWVLPVAGIFLVVRAYAIAVGAALDALLEGGR